MPTTEAGSRADSVAAQLEVRVLGKFTLAVEGTTISGLESRRAQELFTYLVINGEHVVARETLAETLWADEQVDVRKTLRQALWKMQSALGDAVGSPTVQTDTDFVGLHPDAAIDADVLDIASAYDLACATGAHLTEQAVETLRAAASRYRGELLPGCGADWCVIERERFHAMYLAILDRLMVNAEEKGDIDSGLWYGEQILRHDRASERTHRRLIALRYLSGDRTGAMRQYESCRRALATELDVVPAPATEELHQLVRRSETLPSAHNAARRTHPDGVEAGPAAILRGVHETLLHACDQIASVLVLLEHGVRHPGDH